MTGLTPDAGPSGKPQPESATIRLGRRRGPARARRPGYSTAPISDADRARIAHENWENLIAGIRRQ
ncbi:hypothetical protein DMA12_33100 [Amycolatopsis balhimycina DSM 5908]|uniref:Uncharacterized protein n=1 Tax=Amycolatopsis balhimycina DSM 5908 TaxID=1081091 RepID=A0A428W5Z0_AMYBA|nr:hypothetical protein DMA12_33100 [Amycolatopsis balhimycina DSM 5908]